jgi:hypothetical protein
MDNNQNLQYHLTNVNSFDNKNIDIENITIEKTIYSIYNNSISEPFHNFWFLVDNCKFFKSYINKNNSYSLVFVLNNKYEKHKKVLIYIKQLLEHIKLSCEKKYEIINYNLPWTENENYPISIYFQYNTDSLFINYENNNMDINTLELNNNNNFTLLFEIKYFIINNNKIKLILVAKLIRLEKQFDLKKSLITLSSPIKNKIIEDNEKSIFDNNIKESEVENEEGIVIKPIVKTNSNNIMGTGIHINPNMLMGALNKMKKKSLTQKNKIDDDEENKNNNSTTEYYLEEKNLLKKTIINPDKDSYKIMHDNYLEDRGIIKKEELYTTDIKIKKKKIIKIKKKKEI